MFFFFFNDTATTEIYTLSLHDALPIWVEVGHRALHHPGALHHLGQEHPAGAEQVADDLHAVHQRALRSEEHTSELQSRRDLVCRLLLEKKKKKKNTTEHIKINKYKSEA